MKIAFFFVLGLFLIQNIACAEATNSKEVIAVRNEPAAGPPVYLAGQVEWIARIFSPECRNKKTDKTAPGFY